MIEGASKLMCKTCASCAAPKPHRVAKPAALLDFNEAVALDIIFRDTSESTGLPELNVVDMASTYQVVIPLENRKSDTVAHAGILPPLDFMGGCSWEAGFGLRHRLPGQLLGAHI